MKNNINELFHPIMVSPFFLFFHSFAKAFRFLTRLIPLLVQSLPFSAWCFSLFLHLLSADIITGSNPTPQTLWCRPAPHSPARCNSATLGTTLVVQGREHPYTTVVSPKGWEGRTSGQLFLIRVDHTKCHRRSTRGTLGHERPCI